MTAATSTSARTSRLPSWLVGTGVIAVAMAVMNVTTYGFTILAARVLGPVDYGALAAVMGLLLVVNVLSLGLQATGARRVSTATGDPAEVDRLEADVLAASTRSALALGLLMLAAAPLVSATLNLDSLSTAVLVALTTVPLTVMGGQAGILQGERRWVPLALVYLCVGVGRIAFGAAALLVEQSTRAAVVGVLLGAVVPVLVGWLALRHPSRRPEGGRPARSPAPTWAPGSVLRETMANSHALLAFFALSNADVIIARSVLPEHQAGLYAGGLILAKAVLFLPQFVVVIVFPSMSSSTSARRMNLLALALVMAIGLATVLGVALLSGLAVSFVGGPEYAEIRDVLWLFAVLGTLLAMLQLMVYNVVARQRQRAVLAIWVGLAAVLVAGAAADTGARLLAVVLAVDAALFVVLLVRAGVRSRSSTATPAPDATA